MRDGMTGVREGLTEGCVRSNNLLVVIMSFFLQPCKFFESDTSEKGNENTRGRGGGLRRDIAGFRGTRVVYVGTSAHLFGGSGDGRRAVRASEPRDELKRDGRKFFGPREYPRIL